eukprot:273172-Prymnesium_polylepis.1
MSVLPDETIISADQPGVIRSWRYSESRASHQMLAESALLWNGPGDVISFIATSPDGTQLAAATHFGNIHVFSE